VGIPDKPRFCSEILGKKPSCMIQVLSYVFVGLLKGPSMSSASKSRRSLRVSTGAFGGADTNLPDPPGQDGCPQPQPVSG
jgi:hypothetical protein